jgi:AraC-like DNA-binding protein
MKIGGAEFGGIYAGKDVQSAFHRHHFVVLVLSLGSPFRIVHGDGHVDNCHVALLPQDTSYSLTTSRNDDTMFAHFDPYSTVGLRISSAENHIQVLNYDDFLPVLDDVRRWIEAANNAPNATDVLLNQLATMLMSTHASPRNIDHRILHVIHTVARNDLENIDLSAASAMVFLSPTRFSHLFKQETGVTFRKFIQHRKLVTALKSMHQHGNLTDVAFDGGFADQPHFTKTFRSSFGIRPSKSTQ